MTIARRTTTSTPTVTIGATTLLHEAYLKIVQRDWAKARILLHRYLSDA